MISRSWSRRWWNSSGASSMECHCTPRHTHITHTHTHTCTRTLLNILKGIAFSTKVSVIANNGSDLFYLTHGSNSVLPCSDQPPWGPEVPRGAGIALCLFIHLQWPLVCLALSFSESKHWVVLLAGFTKSGRKDIMNMINRLLSSKWLEWCRWTGVWPQQNKQAAML